MDMTFNKRRTWALILALVAIVALVATACGGDDEEGEGPTATPTKPSGIDYSKLSGQIAIDGSSTVYPISQAMAEEFGKESKVRVNVALSGTGGGFEKFCRGETQISDASRPIKDSEKDACAKNGITDVTELQVAIDALTVVVNPKNDWAKCMTVDQLTKAFSTGGASTWKDLDPSWPADKIVFYYPGADSGTFDYFKEAIVNAKDKNATHRSDGTSSEDDNVLVKGVEGDKNAIGYFGFAYFEEAGKGLNAVEVDGGKGGGCVPPTFDNALQGKYVPLSRPIFIYTRESFLKERPEVLGFVNFYFENLEEIVKDVGYITIPEDAKAKQVAKFEAFLPK